MECRYRFVAEYEGRQVAVCVTHSLIAEKYRTGIVVRINGSNVLLRPLNAYQLSRNLPSCHLAIRKCLGLPTFLIGEVPIKPKIPESWSFSALRDFEDCPMRWALSIS